MLIRITNDTDGPPITLLLAIRSKTDMAHRVILGPFSKRIKSDPEFTQLTFLGSVYIATDHLLICKRGIKWTAPVEKTT